ncbi:MAG TPA: hypothetical protein PK120_06920, partial [Syntrophales bacterium]|nr:hypothetical protein [Syntrophales bacterium]
TQCGQVIPLILMVFIFPLLVLYGLISEWSEGLSRPLRDPDRVFFFQYTIFPAVTLLLFRRMLYEIALFGSMERGESWVTGET